MTDVHFHLDPDSDVPPYRQLVRQIRHALRLGLLREGDRLPVIKELANRLSVNQNTVLKAYRELEYAGLVTARPGVGTFVRVTLADAALAAHGPLTTELDRWLSTAHEAGLDRDGIEALIATRLQAHHGR